MSEIRSAVILAAGRGTRMGGLTAELPKPMLPVHGRPILEHVLDVGSFGYPAHRDTEAKYCETRAQRRVKYKGEIGLVSFASRI